MHKKPKHNSGILNLNIYDDKRKNKKIIKRHIKKHVNFIDGNYFYLTIHNFIYTYYYYAKYYRQFNIPVPDSMYNVYKNNLRKDRLRI